jgi:hypothetical protein
MYGGGGGGLGCEIFVEPPLYRRKQIDFILCLWYPVGVLTKHKSHVNSSKTQGTNDL